ncbi:MAG: spore coat protein [Paeniclostridium sordellii]|uniref:Spore coat protein n=1 Tax=Paeniclostridium hominis TaxID=2764329 RepID=A0ABR7K5F9_9FIRM|nr:MULTISPECIES: spore coat protein [Paeniclostridium]MBC6004099.1 spore coat protein [Paeniclostridium hominis]MDU2591233.1 spore coat protein [Paeniclostridium sordellii]
MLNLTTKERMLLEDEKSHEELCVQKYKDYAQKASCSELKNLFNQLAQKEQQHLDSINQLLSGTVPNVNQGQSQGNQNSNSQTNSAMPNLNSQASQGMPFNQHDKMLCQDTLSTEKYISSTYDTAIFEFKDKNVRQVLNHIQKEEQEHGEKIYNYMSQHNMYN